MKIKTIIYLFLLLIAIINYGCSSSQPGKHRQRWRKLRNNWQRIKKNPIEKQKNPKKQRIKDIGMPNQNLLENLLKKINGEINEWRNIGKKIIDKEC